MASSVDTNQWRAAMLVARLTLAEAARQRIAWLVVAAALLMTAAGLGLRDLHFGGAEQRFLLDLGFGAIGLGATALAVVGTAQLFFGELESRAWQFVLARPVSRTAWLAGKLFAALAVVALFCAGLSLVLAGLVTVRAGGWQQAAPWREVLGGGALLWLRAAIAAAITLFLCTYARSAFFASGAALLAVLAGHLRPIAAAYPVEWSAAGLFGLLLRLWPDLQAFEPTEGVVPSVRLLGYGLAYVGLFGAAAGIVFRRREL